MKPVVAKVFVNKKGQIRPVWKVLGIAPLVAGIMIAVSTKVFGQTAVVDNIGKMVKEQGIQPNDTILFKGSDGKWTSASVGQIRNVGDDFDPQTVLSNAGGSTIPKSTPVVLKFRREDPIVITKNDGTVLNGQYFGIKQYNTLYYTTGDARMSILLSEIAEIKGSQ